jgi:hypothetical protein
LNEMFVSTLFSGERKLRPEQQNLLKQKLKQHFDSRWSTLTDTKTDFAQQYAERVEMCCKDEKLVSHLVKHKRFIPTSVK